MPPLKRLRRGNRSPVQVIQNPSLTKCTKPSDYIWPSPDPVSLSSPSPSVQNSVIGEDPSLLSDDEEEPTDLPESECESEDETKVPEANCLLLQHEDVVDTSEKEEDIENMHIPDSQDDTVDRELCTENKLSSTPAEPDSFSTRKSKLKSPERKEILRIINDYIVRVHEEQLDTSPSSYLAGELKKLKWDVNFDQFSVNQLNKLKKDLREGNFENFSYMPCRANSYGSDLKDMINDGAIEFDRFHDFLKNGIGSKNQTWRARISQMK